MNAIPGGQLDELLEWHVDAAKSPGVMVVLEDNLLLSDVTEVRVEQRAAQEG